LLSLSFASKVQNLLLDTVSTTCDSGWVRSLYAGIEEVSRRPKLRTHPLSQVVLTVSNRNSRLL